VRRGERGEDEESVGAGAREGRWRVRLRVEHNAGGRRGERRHGAARWADEELERGGGLDLEGDGEGRVQASREQRRRSARHLNGEGRVRAPSV
jgi:hypothetical protein